MFPSVLIPEPPLGERRDRYLAQLINYLLARFAASGKYLFARPRSAGKEQFKKPRET